MGISDASRASMNFATVQVGKSGKTPSQDRTNITTEAQRRTAGAEAVEYYAARNPAVNTAMTRHNIDMVNDGEGGFRATRSVDEVVAYGDDRLARLPKPPKEGNRVALTAVGQLPWGLCEPDGTYYQPLDTSGQPRVYAKGPNKGKPHLEPRYKIAAGKEAEAMRYFDCWLEYQARLLPDGQKGMHGYSINLDESRPHIQLLSDTFEPDPTKKQPDRLKSGFSRAFGNHRDDRLVQARNEDGTPALLPDGSAKMVREGGGRKMERYHAEHRAWMIERGFDVEAERDESRHDRHLELADYKDLQHSQREVEEVAAGLAAERRRVVDKVNYDLAAVAEAEQIAAVEAAEIDAELTQREAEIATLHEAAATDRRQAAADRAQTQADREAWERELPHLRRRAIEDARAEVEPELRREVGRATANTEATAAAQREAQRLLEEAAEKDAEARARLDATPEYDPVEARQNMEVARYQAGERVKVPTREKDADGKRVWVRANEAIDAEAERIYRSGATDLRRGETIAQRRAVIAGRRAAGEGHLRDAAQSGADRSAEQGWSK